MVGKTIDHGAFESAVGLIGPVLRLAQCHDVFPIATTQKCIRDSDLATELGVCS
ncbi:MAG: hypothetical protein RLZ25_980 [Pseudomonadota bacterium]|jgi:hypothetical protein